MNYVLNKDKEIIDILINKINMANEILISVSYITSSALKYLIENTNILEKKIKVITTTEGYISDPYVLETLLNNDKSELKLINADENTRSFHTKFIILNYKDGFSETINGSFNLTNNAFFNKYELVSIKETIKDNIDHFNYLYNDIAISINQEFIDEYKNKYELNKKLYELFEQDLKNKINLKPNEMQEIALSELSIIRQRDDKIALLWSATGTGKTYLSAFDAKRYNFKKLLFIVHSRTIINSAKKDFENVFSDKQTFELFSKGKRFVEESDIVFTTEKTIDIILKNKPNFLEQFDYFVFDEAHKIGQDNTQGKILNKIKKIKKRYFILGMSATPTRSDNPNYVIESFKNNIVGKITTEEAINKNLISPFKYYGRDVDVDFSKDELSNDKLEYMVNKLINELKENKVWRDEKIKGLVFTKTIKESEEVAKLLTKKGYKSESIHSQKGLTDEDISSYINLLQSDKNNLNFLVIVDKFNEGVDIPLLNTIVMFRFTESHIIYTQQIGRGLRKVEDKGNQKVLNIFDLVGNHDNNFNRILGLSGQISENPKKLLSRIVDLESNDESKHNIFNISEIAKRKILDSLNKLKYQKYFKERIKERINLYQEEISLINIEEVLDESIQIISNNFRKKGTLNPGDKSWVSLALEESFRNQYNIQDLSTLEHQLLELFSWMPFTTSTTQEKKEIIKLLDGKKAILSDKWYSYFSGRNLHTGNISQIVKGDFTSFFKFSSEEELNYIIFKDTIDHSDLYKILITEIKKYLFKYQERNDKLEFGKWYSKVEIGFIAGYTSNLSKGEITIYKKEKHIDQNSIFYTHKLYDKNKNLNYKNEIKTKDKFILSDDGKSNKNYNDPKIKIHNFIGSNKFNRNVLFQYIGIPKNIKKYDTQKTKKFIREDVKEYTRYSVDISKSINDIDYFYLLI